MANDTTNVTATNTNEGAQAPQEEARTGKTFTLPTKEQVFNGFKKAGNVALKVCSITATVGAGIFGALVIGATAKELLSPKGKETDEPAALPEVELPKMDATEEIVPDVDDITAE